MATKLRCRLTDYTGGYSYLPHLIKGDLDSLRPEVKNFYALNARKIHDSF